MDKNNAIDENITSIHTKTNSTKTSNSQGRVYEFSYTPLLFDFIARWFILGHWLSNSIENIFFWIFNIVVIPIVTFLIATRKTEFKAGDTIKHSSLSKLCIFLILITGVTVTWFILDDLHLLLKILLTIITFIVYGFYILFLFVSSPKKIGKNNKWKTNIPQIDINERSNRND